MNFTLIWGKTVGEKKANTNLRMMKKKKNKSKI